MRSTLIVQRITAMVNWRCRLFGWLMLVCMLSTAPALAQKEPQAVALPELAATETVLLVKSTDGEKQYSLRDIEALGLYSVTTTSFWPEDQGTYQGVLLSALLTDAGLGDAQAIKVAAIDHFSQVIPRRDWTDWPLMLATRREGETMSVRAKGPLRIIYPRDMDSELESGVYRLRWVWMVNEISVADDID